MGLASQNPKPDDKPKTERAEPPEKIINSKSQNDHQKRKRSTTAYMKILFPEIEDIIETGLDGPPVAIYIRVSTWLQVLEGQSMEYQKEQLLNLAKQTIKASIIYIISDAGKSGRNFTSRNLGIILQLAAAQKIQRLLVSEVDRAGRDAFELLYYLFQLRSYNVLLQTPLELLDLKRLVDLVNLAFKSAAAEDQVLARGAGSKRTKVGNFLKGEWNLPTPLGYKKSTKKSWIKKAPAWAPVKIFKDIFLFYLEMKNREAVCRTINRQYDNFLMSTLKRHLTSADIARVLKNRVYIGKPCYGEAVREDLTLAYIDDVKIFEKAQEIMRNKSQEYERHDKRIQEVAKYFDPDAIKCIENIVVPCPKCGKPMDGNGYPGYVCLTCNKNRCDLKKTEIANLRHHVLYREQILKLTIKFSKENQLNPKARKEVAELERLLEKAIAKAIKVSAKMKKAKKEVKKIESKD
ncbi:MAG: recombinase family protein [Candidatus Bathyarchaeia archaeon]